MADGAERMIASRLAEPGERAARTLCLTVGRPGQLPDEVSITYTAHHRVSDLVGICAVLGVACGLGYWSVLGIAVGLTVFALTFGKPVEHLAERFFKRKRSTPPDPSV